MPYCATCNILNSRMRFPIGLSLYSSKDLLQDLSFKITSVSSKNSPTYLFRSINVSGYQRSKIFKLVQEFYYIVANSQGVLSTVLLCCCEHIFRLLHVDHSFCCIFHVCFLTSLMCVHLHELYILCTSSH